MIWLVDYKENGKTIGGRIEAISRKDAGRKGGKVMGILVKDIPIKDGRPDWENAIDYQVIDNN